MGGADTMPETGRPQALTVEAGSDSAPPRLSVIMPAYRAEEVLPQSLGALLASDVPRHTFEIIVVVDGDTMGQGDDRTAEVAGTLADVVVRVPGKTRGPSYVRNRGAEVARGEILAFIDSDVCVHKNTLRRILETLDEHPEIDATFGSYDDRPPARGIVSKYRNLLHHYVHTANPGEAETFWAGCGAIRARTFESVGRYDEWHFSQPQIEDIELGRRLRSHGHRIFLNPTIQACHLKRWTLRNVLTTDLKHRGVPWTRLILHEGPSAGGRTLNLEPVHRACVILALVAVLGVMGALVLLKPWPLLATLAGTMGIVFLNAGFFRVLLKSGGWHIALAGVPLHWLFYVANGLSAISGLIVYSMVGAPQPPPDVAAFEEIGVETWPPIPTRPKDSVWYKHGE
jgi:GT2 family glycosyltransferase